MKATKEAQKFTQKTKDPKIKSLLNQGGRSGAKKDFDLILKRASKPSTS